MKASNVLSVATVAVLSLALVACSEASGSTTKQLDVTSVDEKATVFQMLDLGKTGFGPGDQLVEESPVVDAGGQTLGKALTTAAIISGTGMTDFEAVVDCTVELAEGHLVFHGGFASKDLAAGAPVPVVGGTGQYAGATGTVMMIAPTDKKTELKFDLALP